MNIGGFEVERIEDDRHDGDGAGRWRYVFQGRTISRECFTIGFEHPTLGYREKEAMRWAVDMQGPFKTATAALVAVERDTWRNGTWKAW